MDFLGLCSGTDRPTFQKIGEFAPLREKFLLPVRNLSAMGPRWFRSIGAILSAPSALL